jgi:hypothetical protein
MEQFAELEFSKRRFDLFFIAGLKTAYAVVYSLHALQIEEHLSEVKDALSLRLATLVRSEIHFEKACARRDVHHIDEDVLLRPGPAQESLQNELND